MTSSSSTTAATTVFRALAQSRRSVKRFQPNQRIPSHIVKDVLESTLRAPSSFNLQPTQIIMVQNEALKERLAQFAMLGLGNQYRVRECSAVAVFLSDLQASQRIARMMQLEQEWGQRHPTYMAMMPLSTSFLLGEGHAATLLKQVTTDLVSETTSRPMPHIEPIQSWSYKNTALAAQTYLFAAQSHQLDTCIMEGFDPRRMKEVLCIPDRYGIPMVIGTGYEYQEEGDGKPKPPKLTPRLPLEEVVFQDRFGDPMQFRDGDDGEEDDDDEDAPAQVEGSAASGGR